jgi:hypothetical protein
VERLLTIPWNGCSTCVECALDEGEEINVDPAHVEMRGLPFEIDVTADGGFARTTDNARLLQSLLGGRIPGFAPFHGPAFRDDSTLGFARSQEQSLGVPSASIRSGRAATCTRSLDFALFVEAVTLPNPLEYAPLDLIERDLITRVVQLCRQAST